MPAQRQPAWAGCDVVAEHIIGDELACLHSRR